MQVNARSAHRWGFKCPCCQTAPGKDRVRERQAWKKEIHA